MSKTAKCPCRHFAFSPSANRMNYDSKASGTRYINFIKHLIGAAVILKVQLYCEHIAG